MTRLICGTDIGGTFTDFVSYDPETAELEVWKRMSTPQNPTEGVVAGLLAAEKTGKISLLRLGTTIATNAVLERNGAVVGYITTKGFKDIPFIQRGKRRAHYDMTWIKPKPFVNRRHCFEVDERIGAEGQIIRELDENQVREIARELKRNGEIESIAVMLLFSYARPDHERRIRDLLSEECPELPVSISYEVLPKWKEYQRASTTIADAYIKPIVSTHLQDLYERLQTETKTKNMVVIRSNGGEMGISQAVNSPVQMTFSGPTGGVVGARHVASQLGIEHIVTLDMGGTSTDVSTIVGGKESFSTNFEIEFGVPIQIPMIDIRTIGAGGGSLAWIDSGGMLRVGPHSAGAQPGPASYDLGGTEPTVTDANVVLGRIDPDLFLGGRMKLNQQAAIKAVNRISSPLGLSDEDGAMAIVRIVNNNMVGALRSVLVERGLDPRDFTLMGFGGAGPVHISDLMKDAGIGKGVIPNHPGQFSAFGFIMTDARVDLERTAQMTSVAFDEARANAVLSDVLRESVNFLKTQGISDNIQVSRSVEMRYFAQNHELDIPIYYDEFTPDNRTKTFEDFHAVHLARFGFQIPGEKIEMVNVKITAAAVGKRPVLKEIGKAETHTPKAARTRLVFFESGSFDTKIYFRDRLRQGHIIKGPALIEEDASVTVLQPEQQLTVDRYGNLMLEPIS